MADQKNQPDAPNTQQPRPAESPARPSENESNKSGDVSPERPDAQ